MTTSQAPRQPELLPLVRLLGAPQHSPWTVGIATTLALGLTGSAAVLLGASQGVAGDRLYDSAAQLWVNSAATGYVLGIMLYETRRLCGDLARLHPHLRGATALADSDLFQRNHHPRALALVTLGGTLYGAFFNYTTDGLLYQAISGTAPAWEYAWGPVVLISLWAAVFHVFWILLDNARRLARIARQDIRVDLANVAAFDVVAHAGIRQLLMIIVGLTVIPIQAIMTGTLRPLDFAPALGVVLPVGIILLALPLIGAHQAIATEKQRELVRLDRDIARARRGSERHMLLALYRHQIESMPAWPLSLRNLAQIALYLVLPPLAWIAAALVESVVSDAL